MPLHPLQRNYTETLKEDRDAIILADQLGSAEAFVGEHITDLAETITSSLIFLASLASETQQIKLCTGTVNLPQNHPALLAAHIAMIDHILASSIKFWPFVTSSAVLAHWFMPVMTGWTPIWPNDRWWLMAEQVMPRLNAALGGTP